MTESLDQKLGDVLTFQRGHDITKKEQSPGPFPVISSGGASSTHSEYRYEGPGVVIGRKGSLGGVYWSDGPYWPHDTTLWVRDFKGNDPKYLYYFLQTLQLERFDAGASNPTLNRNHLHLLEVSVLPPNRQRSVADRLSAFDDLIENNRRQIEILEEMARLLYRERFVHFRYPGHEDVELVDSELGPIPEGWEVKPTGDTFEAIGGGTPSKTVDTYWVDGDIEWYTPSDLTKNRQMFAFASGSRITEAGLAGSSAKKFPAGSVMLTSRATIGEIAIATTEATTNQGFITCVPNECVTTAFLYFWLGSNVDRFLQLAGGATFKELRKSTFRELQLAVPPVPMMDEFTTTVSPQLDLVANLIQQNRVLREARDLLLPRLVSGELDVSGLDLEGVLT
jgi:type I restriction enzyme S subunit